MPTNIIANIENLSYSYHGENKPVLDRVNLTLSSGDFVTLAGPSGCGKTTLALSLTGFIPHSYNGTMTGSVTVNNINTKDIVPGTLAGVVGMVQQDPEMQTCTLKVLDEVAFGPENLCLPVSEIKARTTWALKVVGAAGLAQRDMYTLSGGEKQRVAIAAVLAMKPRLIILDEPTANLDPTCTEYILKVIDRMRTEYGTTILILEHRLEKVIPLSNRILIMKNGNIEEVTNRDDITKLMPPLPVISIASAENTPNKNFNNRVSPRLVIENLNVSYDEPILKDVNFSVFPGEITAIMGDNGSGKSTLLYALLGLINNVKGKILIDGKDIIGSKVSNRARRIGLSLQNPNHQLFEKTVLQEAEMTSIFLKEYLPGENKNVLKLLEKFELTEYINQIPFALSMGEKKRLTLASLIAYDPDFLALDEPLVGQDAQRSLYLYETLVEYRSNNKIVLMVCHEPNVVFAWCQRVLFFRNGELLIDDITSIAFEKMATMDLHHYLPSEYRKKAAGKVGK